MMPIAGLVMDHGCELHTIHRSRHINIGEEEANVLIENQRGDRLIRVAGHQHRVSLILEGFLKPGTDEVLMFNYQYLIQSRSFVTGRTIHNLRYRSSVMQGAMPLVFP